MEGVHGVGIAAVLAADADGRAGAGGAALGDGGPDQAADAPAVERLGWRGGEDALVEVGGPLSR